MAGLITKQVLRSMSSPSISLLVRVARSRSVQPSCEPRRAKYCALVCPLTYSRITPLDSGAEVDSKHWILRQLLFSPHLPQVGADTSS